GVIVVAYSSVTDDWKLQKEQRSRLRHPPPSPSDSTRLIWGYQQGVSAAEIRSWTELSDSTTGWNLKFGTFKLNTVRSSSAKAGTSLFAINLRVPDWVICVCFAANLAWCCLRWRKNVTKYRQNNNLCLK